MKNPIFDLKNGGSTYTRVNMGLLLLLLWLLLMLFLLFHLGIEAAEGQVKTIPEKGRKK